MVCGIVFVRWVAPPSTDLDFGGAGGTTIVHLLVGGAQLIVGQDAGLARFLEQDVCAFASVEGIWLDDGDEVGGNCGVVPAWNSSTVSAEVCDRANLSAVVQQWKCACDCCD